MSLYDKKNALQYGRSYAGNAQWKSVSSSYAREPDDNQKKEMQEVIDKNVNEKQQRTQDSIKDNQELTDVRIDVHQVSPNEVQSLRQRAEAPTTHPASVHITVTDDDDTPSPSLQSSSHTVPTPPHDDSSEQKDQQQKQKSVTRAKISRAPKKQPRAHVKKSTPARSAPSIPQLPIKIDRTKHTILIVDDDYDTRTMYATIFHDAGFNVLEAEDGLEGLDLATKHQPDVIFTGIIMPRMDGFTMVEAIKKNAVIGDTPIVINSHLGRTQDKERAKELGIKDFIVRDYTAPREVVDRITALLVTMEYIIPFDIHAPYAKEILADLGGTQALTCDKPVLVLRLSDAKRKMFTATLSCR